MPTITKQTGGNSKPKPTGGVLDRITPLGDTTFRGKNFLFYGQTATGKTTISATFPGPILWIVCSGSNEPGELTSINTPEYHKKVKQVVLQSPEEIRELASYLKDNHKSFSTVILDHATGLQDLVLKFILGLQELPPQLSWGLASQQQYGQLGLQMKEMLRALLNLPQEVVILAQEREFNTEGATDMLAPYVTSNLTPSVVTWLQPVCDYICRTYKRPKFKEVDVTIGNVVTKTRQPAPGVEYCLLTGPHATYTTKFRVPKGHELPESIVDPSYEKIMQVIKGK